MADLAELDAAHAIAGQAAALVGAVDILINNGSALGPVPLRLLLDTECEELARALAVNLVGPFRLTKAIAGSMLLRGYDTVVNLSSDAAVEAYERGSISTAWRPFDADGDALWAALYRAGRPISYSYLEQALPLWAVQTVYAARPWAFEMPSAARCERASARRTYTSTPAIARRW